MFAVVAKLADVAEAEAPVLVLAIAALRRAMRGFLLAANPFACGAVGFDPAILRGFDANAIEEGRVEFHDRQLCAFRYDVFKT